MRLQHENSIRAWFDAWLQVDDSRLLEFFVPDIIYTESYGPQHVGLEQVRRWFADWVQHGRVLRWDIARFWHQEDWCIVEWYFEYRWMGKTDGFDGVSLVRFDEQGKMAELKEFAAKAQHTHPYKLDAPVK